MPHSIDPITSKVTCTETQSSDCKLWVSGKTQMELLNNRACLLESPHRMMMVIVWQGETSYCFRTCECIQTHTMHVTHQSHQAWIWGISSQHVPEWPKGEQNPAVGVWTLGCCCAAECAAHSACPEPPQSAPCLSLWSPTLTNSVCAWSDLLDLSAQQQLL